jgi:predicted DCC family thiol-disulfide oxidoreductase YuxK
MGRARSRRERLHIVYDAECALCTRAVRQLSAVRGARAEFRFVPLQELEKRMKAEACGGRERAAAEPDALPETLNRLDPGALRAQLHVVQADGAVFAGAEAVVRIMRELPRWRLLSGLYRVPGMKRAADAAYRYVARRRYDWFGKADEGCAAGACALPPAAGAGHRKTKER